MEKAYVKDTLTGKTAWVPRPHLQPELFGDRLVEIDPNEECLTCPDSKANFAEALDVPAGNASKSDWSDFLTQEGVAHDPEEGRDDLRALWAETESKREEEDSSNASTEPGADGEAGDTEGDEA